MDDKTALDDTTRPGSQEAAPISAGAPAAEGEAELGAGDALGPCIIEYVLGRGGMGVVYRARHRGLDAPVAVKVLPAAVAQEHPDLAARFLREARLAARLRHPHVVSVLDVGRDAERGLLYMVQDFVSGGSLRDRLRRGRLGEAEALNVASAIGRALVEAEKAGIVHRDIKPDNILLTGDGRVQLADLGLAKQQDGGFDEELTAPKAVLGTPIYMSPEQIRETRTVDIRSDLYSLGATLFHLVTGQPPFRSQRILGLVHKIVTDPAPDPRSLRPELSEPFAALLLRLLEKKPAARFASAAAFVEHLEALRRERGQPVGTPIDGAPSAAVSAEAKADVLVAADNGAASGLAKPASSPPLRERAPRSILPRLGLALAPLLLLPLGVALIDRLKTGGEVRRPGPARTEILDAIPTPAPTPTPAPPSTSQGVLLAELRASAPELLGLGRGAQAAFSFDEGAIVVDGEDRLIMARDQVGGGMLAARGLQVSSDAAAGEYAAWLAGDGSVLDLPELEGERSVACWLQVRELPWPQVVYDSGPRAAPGSIHDGHLLGSGLMLGLCANPQKQPEKLPAPWRYGPDLSEPRVWIGLWARDFFTAPRQDLVGRWVHLAFVIDDDKKLSLWIDGERAPLTELIHQEADVSRRRWGRAQPKIDVSWRSEGERGARFGRVRDSIARYRDPKREGGLWDFVGLLDEAAVWDRPLREEEVRGLVRLSRERAGGLRGSYVRAIESSRRAGGD